MSTCHYRTGTEQLACTCETGSESLVNASSVLKITSLGIFLLQVTCHVLDLPLVYPGICLGYIREQIDSFVCSLSGLPLLESEKANSSWINS